ALGLIPATLPRGRRYAASGRPPENSLSALARMRSTPPPLAGFAGLVRPPRGGIRRNRRRLVPGEQPERRSAAPPGGAGPRPMHGSAVALGRAHVALAGPCR